MKCNRAQPSVIALIFTDIPPVSATTVPKTTNNLVQKHFLTRSLLYDRCGQKTDEFIACFLGPLCTESGETFRSLCLYKLVQCRKRIVDPIARYEACPPRDSKTQPTQEQHASQANTLQACVIFRVPVRCLGPFFGLQCDLWVRYEAEISFGVVRTSRNVLRGHNKLASLPRHAL